MNRGVKDSFLILDDFVWMQRKYIYLNFGESLLNKLKNNLIRNVIKENYKLINDAFLVSNEFIILDEDSDFECLFTKKIKLIHIYPGKVNEIIDEYFISKKNKEKDKALIIEHNIKMLMQLINYKFKIPAKYTYGANVYPAADYELHEPGKKFIIEQNTKEISSMISLIAKYNECFSRLRSSSNKIIVSKDKNRSVSKDDITDKTIKYPNSKKSNKISTVNSVENKIDIQNTGINLNNTFEKTNLHEVKVSEILWDGDTWYKLFTWSKVRKGRLNYKYMDCYAMYEWLKRKNKVSEQQRINCERIWEIAINSGFKP